ncbi:hypothetical protein AGMMS49965_01290 [Bacteroidia bacterium]|nr:hypothetical protein AGMMS49965_01290 [Bacteroidia bacterium]
MTKFKNVFLLAAMAVSAVAFTGCEKDGEDNDNQTNAWDGVLTATNVEGVPDGVTIDAVKAFIGGYEVGSGTYENRGFTLSLLSPLPDKLSPVTNVEKEFPGTTASPADAKGCFSFDDFYVYAYKDGNEVGRFSSDTRTLEFSIVYVDKDVKTTGSSTTDEGYHYTFNLSLKKGWNKMYAVIDFKTGKAEIEMTTTEPSGIPAKWYFEY